MKPLIAIHGGAGVIERADMAPEMEREYRDALVKALEAGERVLAANGSSLDAVVAAVAFMEDSPLFNAGRGAAFTAGGRNELDAAIMDGATVKAGAVTLITRVKNPVKLARLVMEKTTHVMLGGEGAEALARAHGLELAGGDYFFTQRRWESLQKMKAAAKTIADADRHGTVGAVALDASGNLAAATSTGGYTNKLDGRIGDSPIVGAGTYANNETVAVSCTGLGEAFMRTVAAHTVSALMEFKDWSVRDAADHVIRERLAKVSGTGGLIALDHRGNLAMPFTSPGMYRGSMPAGGKPDVDIF